MKSTVQNSNSNSVETLDLAGDLDLEAQFTLTEKTDETKINAAHEPHTLAADDPQNPRNWSSARRIVCALTYSSTAYVASIPTLMRHYNMSQEVALLGVTVTVLGFAAGPLLFGPASELYGRQLVYRLCGLLFSDGLFAFIGPSLGPLASEFLQEYTDFCILVALVPETHGPTLVKWRLAKAGKAPPPLHFTKIMAVFRIALARPMIYLFTEPVVMLVSLYLSVLYGILYGFFEAFSVVYLDIRGFRNTSFGLTYIALGTGFCVAAIAFGTLGQTMYEKSAEVDTMKGRPAQPEARLGVTYIGAIISPM
ncbi:hypothetical protein C8R45DRAFT_921340 [Mycena sanguinolenta]|nr:hypothetical protein C8R45DRAFT_921340 [Mycena sanguinolenta]